jgi:hypothetical protein
LLNHTTDQGNPFFSHDHTTYSGHGTRFAP